MSLLFIMVFIFNAREPEKPVYINREKYKHYTAV